jgi:hypothetical protein
VLTVGTRKLISYRLRVDHLILRGGGGGGLEDSVCASIFFWPRGIRQIFFSCKSAAQDFFPNIFRGRIFFFAPHNNGLQ